MEAGGEGPPMSEEDLRAALEEQMKHIRVDDVILQTVATLVNLAGRRLGLVSDDPAERDIEQARQAIDASRALAPLAPADQREPITQALTQLQMAFAREAGRPAGATPGGEATAGAPARPPAEPRPPAEDPAEAERAKARAKLWTPPGT